VKRKNAVRLGLEVLEDRMALSSIMMGSFNGTPPPLPPIGSSGLMGGVTPTGYALTGYGHLPSFQGQLQSFQANQIAMTDLIFTEMASMLQQSNL
jgi:hypothetical protein